MSRGRITAREFTKLRGYEVSSDHCQANGFWVTTLLGVSPRVLPMNTSHDTWRRLGTLLLAPLHASLAALWLSPLLLITSSKRSSFSSKLLSSPSPGLLVGGFMRVCTLRSILAVPLGVVGTDFHCRRRRFCSRGRLPTVQKLALHAVTTSALDKEVTLLHCDLSRLFLSRSALVRAFASAFARLARG